ncbi:hypothetical protein [Aeoliella sp.]|uniref:hypothetical protein n=1 Tax=Aeoliella sp. TaxID=2795800 RepID=UPI003CCBCFA4
MTARHLTVFAALLCWAAAANSEESPETPLAKSLALAYWDESRFAAFEDRAPLSVDERRETERLVAQLANFDRRVFYASPGTPVTTRELLVSPEKYRGKPVRWQGTATQVIEPTREMREITDVQPALTCLAHDEGSECMILTHSLPERWQTFALDAEPIAVDAVFVKLVETEGGDIVPLLASPHVEWLPDAWRPPEVNYGMSALGILGFDVSLLDSVVHRAPLVPSETAAFYHLMSNLDDTPANELVHWAQRQLPRYRDAWKESGQQGDDKHRRLVREVLRRADEGQYSVAPFFNAPSDQVGELVVFDGVVRRALRIDTTRDLDATAAGIDHYYELALFTSDSQNNPIMFCVLDLPKGMTEGDNIRQPVRIAGFFFKNWRYSGQSTDGSGDEKLRFAPLFIGRGPLRLVDPPTQPIWGWIAGLGFIAVILMLWLLGWRRSRGDRAFAASTLARVKEPVEPIDLDDAQLPGESE